MGFLRPEYQKSDELLEKLADLEHKQWTHWIQYMDSKKIQNPDGSIQFPAELWQHWLKQVATPYLLLTEEEKKSDREWAQRVLGIAVLDAQEIFVKWVNNFEVKHKLDIQSTPNKLTEENKK